MAYPDNGRMIFLNFESDVRVRIPTPWPFGAAPSDAHSVWREKAR
jgi:hypothetical protein